MVYRSSDSTKYGTNKSSGTSVTSGNHQKIVSMTSSAHESVSIGKPPIHPHTQRSVASIAPAVHSTSNNRLYNNTIFANNKYTFSLSRNGGYGYAQCSGGDGGYLDTRPFSTASLYEDSGRVSRGTKSDIGVSSRRHPSSKSLINNHADCKSKLPSVKSDFLLSYLSNSSSSCNTGNATSRTNNLASGAYHISDGSDYHFKTVSKYLHSSGNGGNASKRNHSGCNAQPRQVAATNICLSPTTSVNNNSSNNNNNNENNQRNSVVNTSNYASQMNSNAVGPLLYLDSSASNRMMGNHEYTSNSQLYQSMQSVSKNSFKKGM